MIDLHSHVLPGVDDGPGSMEGALALARTAAAAGIRTLVATPHVSPRYPTSPATIAAGVAAVSARIAEEGIPVTVKGGAELDLAMATDLEPAALEQLRLGDGPWLLVECPLSPSAAPPDVALEALQALGHRIVLAHPERSPLIQRHPHLLQRYVAAGMLSSITAGSLTGAFGRQVRDFSFELLERGLVHNVTSDAHDHEHRPPGIRRAVLIADGTMPGLHRQLEWLTIGVPGAILAGEQIPSRPVAPGPGRRGALAGSPAVSGVPASSRLADTRARAAAGVLAAAAIFAAGYAFASPAEPPARAARHTAVAPEAEPESLGVDRVVLQADLPATTPASLRPEPVRRTPVRRPPTTASATPATTAQPTSTPPAQPAATPVPTPAPQAPVSTPAPAPAPAPKPPPAPTAPPYVGSTFDDSG